MDGKEKVFQWCLTAKIAEALAEEELTNGEPNPEVVRILDAISLVAETAARRIADAEKRKEDRK